MTRLRRRGRAVGRSVVAVLLAGVVACAVAGCSEPPPNIATHTASDGMDALMGGAVTITATCVTLTDADGTVWTPVFPKGSVTLVDGGILFRGTTYADGDPIELAGGAVEAATDGIEGFANTQVPYGCPTARLWIVAPA